MNRRRFLAAIAAAPAAAAGYQVLPAVTAPPLFDAFDAFMVEASRMAVLRTINPPLVLGADGAVRILREQLLDTSLLPGDITYKDLEDLTWK